MHDSLLLGSRPERLRELATILSAPAAAAASSLEAALPDLLRDGDDAVLSAVAAGLGAFREEAGARRVLETLARRAGPVRAAALRALRGEAAMARAGVVGQSTPPVASLAEAAPTPALAPQAPVVEAAPAATRVPGADWAAPFEAVLAAPTSDAIRRAALALLELADRRPPAATQEALDALAGRLAMASFDHEGAVQQGLARLAKGLKAL